MDLKTIQEIKDVILKSDEKYATLQCLNPLIVSINDEFYEYKVPQNLVMELLEHPDFETQYDNMQIIITLKK